ncbi:hypothetical protein Bca52824_063442 [Brassica carinata]|uniref:NLP1-9 GAF domain-containing protein n=1 Tax=Brassica carinata TaxID=52824 RepID=A0A8X7QGE6_BRACI|nr:hypothetical protein Bca52824_063442 [Brassica carinata]
MEDSFLQTQNAVMDTEFMDGLLLDGCWLETTDGSEFLNLPPFDPSSFMWSPPQDTSAICTSGVVSQTYGQDCADEFQYNKRGGKRVLTTKEQPFSHDPMCQRLANYREISVNYHFSAEQDDSKALAGLPGRVFLGKLPEWTPDVRFFKSEEYPRVQHAQDCDVRGTLAIPVFEQGSKICLGVIEVVMTTEMVKLKPELESICRALQAVDLRSTELPVPPSLKKCRGGTEDDLHTFLMPLAQRPELARSRTNYIGSRDLIICHKGRKEWQDAQRENTVNATKRMVPFIMPSPENESPVCFVDAPDASNGIVESQDFQRTTPEAHHDFKDAKKMWTR